VVKTFSIRVGTSRKNYSGLHRLLLICEKVVVGQRSQLASPVRLQDTYGLLINGTVIIKNSVQNMRTRLSWI